jgi:hypothetical protein
MKMSLMLLLAVAALQLGLVAADLHGVRHHHHRDGTPVPGVKVFSGNSDVANGSSRIPMAFMNLNSQKVATAW